MRENHYRTCLCALLNIDSLTRSLTSPSFPSVCVCVCVPSLSLFLCVVILPARPASERHHGGKKQQDYPINLPQRGNEGDGKERKAHTHTVSIYSTQFPYFTTLIFLMTSYQPATIRMINWKPNAPDYIREKDGMCWRLDWNLSMFSTLNMWH